MPKVYRFGAEVHHQSHTQGSKGLPPGPCGWLTVHESCVFHRPKTDIISLGLVNPPSPTSWGSHPL